MVCSVGAELDKHVSLVAGQTREWKHVFFDSGLTSTKTHHQFASSLPTSFKWKSNPKSHHTNYKNALIRGPNTPFDFLFFFFPVKYTFRFFSFNHFFVEKRVPY